MSIHSAQAAFAGAFWHRVNYLVVASRVTVPHAVFGERPATTSIQLNRSVRPGRAEQLGLRANLTELIPSTVPSIAILLEFILDRKNRLKELSTLIQDSAFSAAVSLAPVGVGAVQTVSALAAKILDTFIEGPDRKPILQFSGDFNFREEDGGLRNGYYVLMGSRDAPLPPATDLEVRSARLYAGGKLVDNVSYVVLEVYVTPWRGRHGSAGSAWREKLDELDSTASATRLDPFVTARRREADYRSCLKGLREAQALLARDPMYTHAEAKRIIETEAAGLATTLGIGVGKLGAPATIDADLRELTGVADAAELQRDVQEYEQALGALGPELEARHAGG
jgi:hypothetical protein